jgi:hypothetical protein
MQHVAAAHRGALQCNNPGPKFASDFSDRLPEPPRRLLIPFVPRTYAGCQSRRKLTIAADSQFGRISRLHRIAGLQTLEFGLAGKLGDFHPVCRVEVLRFRRRERVREAMVGKLDGFQRDGDRRRRNT